MVPQPRVPIAIRVATMADLPFVDGLQKKYGKALGYFPRKQFEGYIEMGAVLIAEEETRGQGEGGTRGQDEAGSSPCPRVSLSPCRLGYVISRDRYLKRDELGVIYQLCVAPGHQRGLIGAALVREAFARSAYGCRLYCLWCAQDLEANHFWESLGFVPLAFRTGSRGKVKGGRVHIFWQKRICEGDTATPWWFPFQTSSGAIREDRVVLPIPPGVHWSEVKAVEAPKRDMGLQPMLGDQRHGLKTRVTAKPGKTLAGPGPGKVGILVGGRIKHVDRPGYAGIAPAAAPSVPLTPKPAPKKRERGPREKIDPTFLGAARELRDRYLEHVNHAADTLPVMGKYDVTRLIAAPAQPRALPAKTKALPAAA